MSSRVIVPDPKLDLVLRREIDVPPELAYAAWTTPKHLIKWFTPAPWKTIDCELDLRPGGKFSATMESPEGEIFPNVGCYLEVVPNRRLIWTDALLPGYRPSGKAFMTACVEFEPHGSGTIYTATAIHSDEETRKKHEEMGFQNGWGTALDQLLAYMKSL